MTGLNTMKITIESVEINKVVPPNGNAFYTQTAYAHISNTDGSHKRYPQEINVSPKRDSSGNSIPFPKGDYVISGSSYSVDKYGKLALGYVNLIPAK